VATLRACLIVLRMLLAVANWEDKLIGWLYFGVLHIGWSYLSLSATLFLLLMRCDEGILPKKCLFLMTHPVEI